MPGTIAESPHKNAFTGSVCWNPRTPQSYPTPSLPAVLAFWKQSRVHHLSAWLPVTAPGSASPGCDLGEADSRSQRDKIVQNVNAADYQWPAAKSLLLLFIFKQHLKGLSSS